MSTILKALRRLEKEKGAPVTERPLREAVAAPHLPPAPKRNPWLAPVIALVLGVGVGASVLLFWPGRSADTEVANAGNEARVATAPAPSRVAPVASPPAPKPGRAARAAPPAGEPAAGPPDQAYSSGVSVVDRPDARPRIEASPTAPDAAKEPPPGSTPPAARYTRAGSAKEARQEVPQRDLPTPAPTPKRNPVVAKAEPAPRAPAPKVAVTPDPAATPEPAQPTPVPKSPPAEPEVASAKPAPAPEAPAPEPAAAKAAAPKPRTTTSATAGHATEIKVSRTRWHPLPQRREAVLEVSGADPVRVHEGDVVGAGYRVSEIEPSGIVLERDGETITRAIGN